MDCDQTDSLFLQEPRQLQTYLLFQSTKFKTMSNSCILQTKVAKQAVFDNEAAVFFCCRLLLIPDRVRSSNYVQIGLELVYIYFVAEKRRRV